MTEQELLTDCLRRLNRLGIDYMVTGSMASNAWGVPRTTHDLDFVIQLPPSQVAGLAAAFTGDYYTDEPSVRSAYRPPHQFNIIHVPSALKLDFWMLRSVRFEQEMFRRRQRLELFGEPAWVATPEDVILHKLYWHTITPSDRQLGDVAGVVAVQKDNLDKDYMRNWAAEIGVAALLEEALSGRNRPKTT